MKQILVEVRPNSSQLKIEKITENVYKIWLTAAPTGNKANNQLIKLLAKHFKVAQANIKIKTGKTSKNKVVIIYG